MVKKFHTDFTLGDCLFGVAKLTKNDDLNKYGLDNATIMTDTKCSRLNYNGSNSFLYLSGIKVYQFKAKDSKLKPYLLCLGNTLKYSTVKNIKKNRVKWICMIFCRFLYYCYLLYLGIHICLRKKYEMI